MDSLKFWNQPLVATRGTAVWSISALASFIILYSTLSFHLIVFIVLLGPCLLIMKVLQIHTRKSHPPLQLSADCV